MDVGLFGGTFNPPHLAHLVIAEAVRDQFGLDEVLWMPSRNPPHKDDADIAPAACRLAMTRLTVQDNPSFRVSKMEMEREGPSYTVETLRQLQEHRPSASFSLIIGGDSLRTFDEWHRGHEIIERAPLIVYDRFHEGSEEPLSFRDRVHFVDAPMIDISSTDIRARCRKGRSIRYMVPESVRNYIRKHGIYRG